MQENKNNNRSFKIITVVALCVAVLCLSVAYAALSQNLNITGTATVEGSNWEIKNPTDPTEGDKTPGTEIEGEVTDGDGYTSIKVTAKLKKPGDFAELDVPVKNNGDIDAHLANITGDTDNIKCTGTLPTKEADEEIICTNGGDGTPGVVYTIKYGDKDSEQKVTEGVTGLETQLAAGAEKNINIRVEYVSTATKTPTNAVTVELPEITFGFQQGLN